jgi:chemotaxis protein histidine kinase CheA
MMIVFLVGVFTLLVCFAGGWEKPEKFLFWLENSKKTKKNILLYFGAPCLVCILILVGVVNAQQQATLKAEADSKSKQLEDKQNSYLTLLDSDKTYDNMTDDERKLADGLVSNFSSFEQDFKDKYQTRETNIKDSRKRYIEAKKKAADDAKAKADDDAKKAKEDADDKAAAEAKKAKDEADAKLAAEKAGDERLVKATHENPIHVTISDLNKSINNYTGYYVVFEGDVVYIKENVGSYNLILSNRYGDLVSVSYLKSTNYQKGQHLVVRALVLGTTSDFEQNGKSVTIPSVSCDYMTSNFYDDTANNKNIIKNDINIEYSIDSSDNITCNYKNEDIIKIQKGHKINLIRKTGSGERILANDNGVIQFNGNQTIETLNTGVTSIKIVPGYAEWNKAVKINIIVE